MRINKFRHDPKLLGSLHEGDSWTVSDVFCAAMDGLRLTKAQAEIFAEFTGGRKPPTEPVKVGVLIAGRRSGKDDIAADKVAHRATCFDYSPHLTRGEHATIPVVCADRAQAKITFDRILGRFEASPMLSKLIKSQTRESIHLTNGVTIPVKTCSYRTLRGVTSPFWVCNETAFWRTDDGSANPDIEVYRAIKPAQLSIPSAQLLIMSTPYRRAGLVWQLYQKYFGKDDPRFLVWKAPTLRMNPRVDARTVEEAFEEDAESAAAEFGADFRSDLESFVSRDAVEAVVIRGRYELPPVEGVRYHGFIDPSGGSRDSFTMAVAHHDRDTDRVILDCVRERKPPFNPDDVVREFATVLASYGLSHVQADHYAGAWVTSKCQEHGITCEQSAEPKSQLYLSLLPLINAGRVELLDHAKCINQLCGLERRTARGGRDSVDHSPNAHDDVINAACGAIVAARETPTVLCAPESIGERESTWSGYGARLGGWGHG